MLLAQVSVTCMWYDEEGRDQDKVVYSEKLKWRIYCGVLKAKWEL